MGAFILILIFFFAGSTALGADFWEYSFTHQHGLCPEN